MEISFCKLKSKYVINVCDGQNLGNISDMIIDSSCGTILGIIVPNNKGFLNFFKSNNDLFIPYNRICKIGKDIILVDIIMQQNHECNCYDYNVNTCQTNNNANKLNIQGVLDDINKNKS